jgi:hypothetical protein
MMEMQKGRRPSKPKGEELFWYLRRNAKTIKYKKNQQIDDEKKRKKRIKKKVQTVSKIGSFISTFCMSYIFKVNKSDR